MANLAASVQGAAAGAEVWRLEQEQAQSRGSLPCAPCLQAMAMRAWPLPLPVVRILRTSWQEQQRRQQQHPLVAGSRGAVRFRRQSKEEESTDWKKEVRETLSRQGSLGLALLSTSAVARSHISPFIEALRANPIFMSGMLAWALAQTLKVFTTYFVERRWDLKMLIGSGGMPSSHSALCIGLTTSVALCHGVSDALFPVCLGFSLIVMYDATGVRRHAGMQAEILNIIVEDLFQGHPISQRKLKELLGHTPLQVAAGACLGMLVGAQEGGGRLGCTLIDIVARVDRFVKADEQTSARSLGGQ